MHSLICWAETKQGVCSKIWEQKKRRRNFYWGRYHRLLFELSRVYRTFQTDWRRDRQAEKQRCQMHGRKAKRFGARHRCSLGSGFQWSYTSRVTGSLLTIELQVFPEMQRSSPKEQLVLGFAAVELFCNLPYVSRQLPSLQIGWGQGARLRAS